MLLKVESKFFFQSCSSFEFQVFEKKRAVRSLDRARPPCVS